MKTRILRMINRTPIDTPNGPWRNPVWRVAGLGQLQPVLFAFDGERGITLSIEDAAVRHGRIAPCIRRLPLRSHKAMAKRLFAELERHKANGTKGAALAAWDSRA